MRASVTRAAKSAADVLRGPVKEVVAALLKEGRHDEVLEVVSKLVDHNAELVRLVEAMRTKGRKGEGFSKKQLDFFIAQVKDIAKHPGLIEANDKLEGATTKNRPAEPDPARPPKQPPVRKPAPPHLRRIDNPIPVPADERACPRCQQPREPIKPETTEVIDLIPAEIVVRVDIREKLCCKACDGELVRAPAGDKVVPGGLYGSGLVAHMTVAKYKDGLPLHRINDQFERLGLRIPSSTMANQIEWATDLLRPIWRVLQEMVLEAEFMHVDGTGYPVLDRENKTIRLGSLWGFVGGQDCAAFLYTSTGKREAQRPTEVGPIDFLKRRRGYIIADASSLFDPLFTQPGVFEVGCNMHGRRYFVRALDGGDVRAALPVDAFKALYEIEERLQLKGASREERTATRQDRSKPIYEELLRWAVTYKDVEPPSSPLGKAVAYLLNHQVALQRFLDDGGIPIDNGIVERLFRRPALLRNASLFAGSDAGAERAAIAFSVLATCDLVDLNPDAYLSDVLPRLAKGISVQRDLPRLMPAAWRAEHAGQAQ